MPNLIYTVQQISDAVSKQISELLGKYPTNRPINYMLNDTNAHTDNINSPINNQDAFVDNSGFGGQVRPIDSINAIDIENNYAGIFDVKKAYKNQFTSALILTGLTDVFHQRMKAGIFSEQGKDADWQYSSVYSPAYGQMAKNIAKLSGLPYVDNLVDVASSIFPAGIDYVTNLIRANIPLKKDLKGNNPEKLLNLLSHTTSFMTPDVSKVGFNELDMFMGNSITTTNLTKHGITFPFLFMVQSLFSKESYKEIGIYDNKRVENNIFNRILSGEIITGLDILNSNRKGLSLIPKKLSTIINLLVVESNSSDGPWFLKDKYSDLSKTRLKQSNSNILDGDNRLTNDVVSFSYEKLDTYYRDEMIPFDKKQSAIKINWSNDSLSMITSPGFYQGNIYHLPITNQEVNDPNQFDFHFSSSSTKRVKYQNYTDYQDMSELYFKASIENLNESYDSTWQTKESFGRMDKIAIYNNTARTVSFTFKLAAETPEEQQLNLIRLDWLAKHAYATYYNKENTFGFYRYPFLKMTIGGLYKNLPGYLTGLKIDVEKTAFWELGKDSYKSLWNSNSQLSLPATPQVFTINATFNVIYDAFVDGETQFYDIGVGTTPQEGYKQTATESQLNNYEFEYQDWRLSNEIRVGEAMQFLEEIGKETLKQAKMLNGLL